jgi:hypothetical protein
MPNARAVSKFRPSSTARTLFFQGISAPSGRFFAREINQAAVPETSSLEFPRAHRPRKRTCATRGARRISAASRHCVIGAAQLAQLIGRGLVDERVHQRAQPTRSQPRRGGRGQISCIEGACDLIQLGHGISFNEQNESNTITGLVGAPVTPVWPSTSSGLLRRFAPRNDEETCELAPSRVRGGKLCQPYKL